MARRHLAVRFPIDLALACALLASGLAARASATSAYDASWTRYPLPNVSGTVYAMVPFAGKDWDGKLVPGAPTFVTGVGAGTTYPDYKPAPFIVASQYDGVDMVTVVTEGIFSYCGVKVKIDTDRHVGPEQATVKCDGEPVGHVMTAE